MKFLTEEGDVVMDPFLGSAVTGEVCEKLGRNWFGFEVVPEYLEGARLRFPPGELSVSEGNAEAPQRVAPHPEQLRLLDRAHQRYRPAGEAD